MEIIGLAGKARSGKNHIYETCFRHRGYASYAYAWPLKATVVGKERATIAQVFTEKGPEVRPIIVHEGNIEGRNRYGDAYWVRQAQTWLYLYETELNIHKVVITDVRFPMEIAHIRACGGRIFYVSAPDRVAESDLTLAQKLDISETAINDYKDYDGVIHNTKNVSAEELEEQVRRLLV